MNSTLEIILYKPAAICSPIESVIQIARQEGVDIRLLEHAARELDRLRAIEIKADDVLRSAAERTRELENLAHAIRQLP